MGFLATVPALTAADDLQKFLGAQSCASALCHGGADEKRNQFGIWSKKDFHTRAPATLSMARSARMAETLKIADATADTRCTTCHNPFQSVPTERKGPLVTKLEGVSCESCHNAAEPWILTHTRTDLSYEQKVSAGLRDLKNLYVRANTCVACHSNLDPDLRAAGHPELLFELDGQCAAMPRHWRETNQWRRAQSWLVGQAVALRETAAAVSAGKASPDATNRAAALAWLLEANALGADRLARDTAAETWRERDVVARLTKLAGSADAFLQANVAKAEQPHRAERLVLGLERALVSLKLDRDPVLSTKLEQLFKDVQSRPDFDAARFADHLRDFHAAVARMVK